jgi:SHS2 domain-containing protein
MKRFEEIPHTADWSFRAFGRDLPELFENAAYALFAMQGAASNGQEERPRRVAVVGLDYESLLVNWLNEILFLQESERQVYDRFEIKAISAQALEAQAFGAPVGKIDKVVKAVTYHNLKIEQTPEGWQAVLVVDV